MNIDGCSLIIIPTEGTANIVDAFAPCLPIACYVKEAIDSTRFQKVTRDNIISDP